MSVVKWVKGTVKTGVTLADDVVLLRFEVCPDLAFVVQTARVTIESRPKMFIIIISDLPLFFISSFVVNVFENSL